MNDQRSTTAHWNVRIDAVLAARVEMALWDPQLKKPRYRSRKMLIEYLLEKWLQDIAVQENPDIAVQKNPDISIQENPDA